MSKPEERISEILDVEYAVEKQVNDVSAEQSTKKEIKQASLEQADSDYALVRKNLKNIINQSEAAIEGILDVASESESPRAYEVVSQLIHSSLDANTKLLELHKRMKDLKKEEGGGGPKSITNNSIYVGSTAELQKFLAERKKAKQLEKKDADEEQ
jgi:hypothetical protein